MTVQHSNGREKGLTSSKWAAEIESNSTLFGTSLDSPKMAAETSPDSPAHEKYFASSTTAVKSALKPSVPANSCLALATVVVVSSPDSTVRKKDLASSTKAALIELHSLDRSKCLASTMAAAMIAPDSNPQKK